MANDESCRRCSECIGQDHHWIEGGSLPDECPDCITAASDYVCKHCPARRPLDASDEPEFECGPMGDSDG